MRSVWIPRSTSSSATSMYRSNGSHCDGLNHESDRLARAKQRSAYAIEVLWREVRRNRQREALRTSAGAWKPENHPELSLGGAAYVEKIRSERDGRFEDALRKRRS
jgi:hypothetical protein